MNKLLEFIETDNLIENVSGPNAETNNIYMYLV